MNYKAADPVEEACQALRTAFEAGDAAAAQNALQQLEQAVQSMLAPASGLKPVASKRTDASPTTVVAKAARGFDALMDGVSQHLRRTGGRGDRL